MGDQILGADLYQLLLFQFSFPLLTEMEMKKYPIRFATWMCVWPVQHLKREYLKWTWGFHCLLLARVGKIGSRHDIHVNVRIFSRCIFKITDFGIDLVKDFITRQHSHRALFWKNIFSVYSELTFIFRNILGASKQMNPIFRFMRTWPV